MGATGKLRCKKREEGLYVDFVFFMTLPYASQGERNSDLSCISLLFVSFSFSLSSSLPPSFSPPYPPFLLFLHSFIYSLLFPVIKGPPICQSLCPELKLRTSERQTQSLPTWDLQAQGDTHQPSDTEATAMDVGGSVVREPSAEIEHHPASGFLLRAMC